MLKYIIKRVLMMIPVLLGVTILIFTMLYFADGDPARTLAGADASEEEVQKLRDKWGLNDSYLVRLGNYIKQVVVDQDLGTSYRTGKEVSEEILQRFNVTFSLALISIAFSVLFGVVMGVISAVHQNTWIDSTAVFAALLGASMPGFVLALLLSLLFALKLGWVPPSGWGEPIHLVLPVISFGISHAAALARQTRSSMLEVIRQDYIVTAKAKGLSRFKVIYVHALRNALIPIVTQMGMMLGNSIGGVVVAETIFSIPGLGTYIVQSINARDYPAVQGGILLIAFGFGVIMLLVDVVYAFIDPRIGARYQSGKFKLRFIFRKKEAQ